MKTQFLISKRLILVLGTVLIGFWAQDMSYGEDAVTGEITECSGVRRDWPLTDWVDVTIRGTLRANRDVENLQVTGSANGDRVGFKFLGDLSAGQSETFTITGFIVTNANRLNCGISFEWLELRNPDPPSREPDPTPAQQPAEQDELGAEQPEETSKICRVGDVLAPGESCTYPGTGEKFSVLDNGSGRFLFFTAGTGLNLRGSNINGKPYTFVASKRGDGKWVIEAVGSATAPGEPKTGDDPQPAPPKKPDLVVTSVRVSDTTVSPGESFTLSTTLENQGTGASTGTTLRYYRSTDNNISTNDTEVGSNSINALGANRTSDESISLTAPTVPGTYYYGACVDSVANESNSNNNCASVRITVARQPAALVISSGNDQDGTPSVELADPLVVQVLDANDNGIADVKVNFRVMTGQGKLSSYGPGQAVTVTTNSRGFAEVPFTPTSAGTVTVQASVVDLDPVTFTVNAGPSPAKLIKISGDNQHGKPGTRLANPFVVEVQDKNDKSVEGIQVTFQVIDGGGRLSTTTATTGSNGRVQTSLTLGNQIGLNTVQASVEGLDDSLTFQAISEAEVLITESQRPPIYWIDTQVGTLHRLVGPKVENLIPSVQNATSLTVDMTGSTLYWTEQTSEMTGEIRRANLDGTNVELVKELTSIPYHLALDTTVGKLYLTNSWGKVQRLNVDGTNFEPNLITDLDNLKGMALDVPGGKVYWINQLSERSGEIRRANLDGTNVELVKELTSVPYSIAVDALNRKLYLTNSWGKVQRLNVDGTNFEPNLIAGLASPQGVAVDAAGGKVYWIETGSLRRADLNGENIQDVVRGLGAPGGITLDIPSVPRSTAVDPATTPLVVSEDVNEDGVVDVQDLTYVAERYGQTGTTAADVNEDGVVNIDDLILIAAVLDADAAAAPSLHVQSLELFTVADIEVWLFQARQRDFADPSVRKGIQFLEQLLTVLTPKETALLANYPNPFNPETWIPYQLSKPADVTLTIYDIQGRIVRALDLGHQRAGMYQSRSYAAYWDGKNAFGEPVASGIYFYTLTAGDFTATRKMLIRK